MTQLTRRRDPARGEDHWQIFYGDVQVGSIGRAHFSLTVGLELWLLPRQQTGSRGERNSLRVPGCPRSIRTRLAGHSPKMH